jgi:hypothetical protein
MKIKSESELLKPEVRKRIIEEIQGRENQIRKYQAYKRYQCYKDKTNHYVVELLLRQFDQTTVEEMRYALSNISIVKKVIDKLARVYSNGVERTISGDENATKKLKELEKKLDVNTAVKKANRFLKLEKNVDLFVKPCPVYDLNNIVKWTAKLEAYLPFLYDVVEDQYDRTKAMCMILSDYTPPSTSLANMDGKRSPISPLPDLGGLQTTDGKDGTLADNPKDQKQDSLNRKTFIFWSKNFHFTCDESGAIIPDTTNAKNENPLKVFNHINFAIDQDGSFWAEGGDDLIDGAILINALITHTTHVGTVQGYGQFYMTGENLPRSIKVGPTKAIIAEYKKDEQAKPEMGFLNANPQLDSLRGLIEMYIALYLTTNNLSTSGVSTQLSGGATLPSGIALILDKAESLEDIQDQRQVFIDKEPDMWEAINQVLKTYGDANLVDELKGLQLPDDFKKNFNIKFHDPTPIMSEAEKLGNMRLRQEMGIDTMISLMMKDDPSLSEEQAEEKLKKLIGQRLKEKMLEQNAMKELGIEIEDEGGDLSEEGQEENKAVGGQAQGQGEEVNDETEEGDTDKKANGNGTPTVGDTASAVDNIQQQALNGAQVTSLVDIVEKVAAGTLPRDSAINMIVMAFNVKPEDAERVLGTAGNGFKPTKEEPTQTPFTKPQGQVNDEGDQQNDQ